MFWGRAAKTKKVPREESIGAPTVSRVLYLPEGLLRDTHEYFAPYWRARVESAAFWAGIELGHTQVATTLVAPGLLQTAGNFQVTRESLRRMARHLRSQGLKVLAQNHTHPTQWVGHSGYDDANAYSTGDGALSLVWPDYGAYVSCNLEGIGIHECYRHKWVELDQELRQQRIQVVGSFADFRWQIVGGIANVER